MAKAASSDELRQGFEEHLEQTKGHVQRLEKIFQALGESPKGKKCKGMEGLIEEGSEAMEEDYEGSVLDAALIGAAQRVEHYEIAGYGTVRSMAETLGETDHVSLLEETLNEEKKPTRNSPNWLSRSIHRRIRARRKRKTWLSTTRRGPDGLRSSWLKAPCRKARALSFFAFSLGRFRSAIRNTHQ